MRNVDVKKPFGSSVRLWRNRLGISQEELAERAGLHRTYISDVERGARNLSLESIEKLAGALEISVAKLFSYADGVSAEKHPRTPPLADELVDILLVEDRSADVELTLAALKTAMITNHIHVVRDGAAALEFLFCTGQYAHRHTDERPKLILLDLSLPKISGLEVLQRIKSEPKTRAIPVVVLTGSSQERDIAMSNQLGADAYIIKPMDFQNLIEVTPQLSLQWALLKPLVATAGR